MVYVYLTILLIYLILIVASRKIETKDYEKTSSLQTLFLKLSIFLHPYFPPKKEGYRVTNKIEELKDFYPFKTKKQLQQQIAIEQRSLKLMVLFVGIFVCFLVSLYEFNKNEEITKLQRNEGGQGNYLQELMYTVGDVFLGEVDLIVKERIYTSSEIETLLQTFLPVLDKNMLQENSSFDEVTSDLQFLDKIEPYPFQLEWQSSDYQVIAYDGSLGKLENQQVNLVNIQCKIRYENYEWLHEVTVHVKAVEKSLEEQIQELIEKETQKNEEENPNEQNISLPNTFGKEKIRWYRKTSYYGPLCLVATIFLTLTVGFLKVQDQRKMQKKRKEELLHEYPQFVSKLCLYLTAGLTLRATLIRLCEEYHNKSMALGDTLHLLVRELEAGVALSETIQSFGKRSKDSNYLKLSSLLIQNEKNGTKDILDRLNDEAEAIFEERKRRAKKLGEEASTKLLLPMMLLLMVLMAMIMIPAFMNFSL